MPSPNPPLPKYPHNFLDHQTLSQATQVHQSMAACPGSLQPPCYRRIRELGLFVNLVLSLTCALMSTMLQQWTRRYRQLTQRNYSPNVRAHIREYFARGATGSAFQSSSKLCLPSFTVAIVAICIETETPGSDFLSRRHRVNKNWEDNDSARLQNLVSLPEGCQSGILIHGRGLMDTSRHKRSLTVLDEVWAERRLELFTSPAIQPSTAPEYPKRTGIPPRWHVPAVQHDLLVVTL